LFAPAHEVVLNFAVFVAAVSVVSGAIVTLDVVPVGAFAAVFVADASVVFSEGVYWIIKVRAGVTLVGVNV